jgi:hypothetical protein
MSNQTLNIEDVLGEIRSFIPRLVEASEAAAELFYLPVTDETWESIGEVMQGMDDLYRTLQTLNDSLPPSQYALQSVIGAFLPVMADKFALMNRCSDNENYVAAADIIKHELTPLFRQLVTSLGEQEERNSLRFSTNLAYLKEKFPDVYKQVEAAVPESEQYQITYAKNGAPNLVKYVEETTAVSLYSVYNPQYEAQKWVDSVASAVTGKTDIIIYGFGYGYHLERLSEVFGQHQCYVYEPDVQIFLAAMRAVDLETIFSRQNIRHLAVGSDKGKRRLYLCPSMTGLSLSTKRPSSLMLLPRL